MKELIITIGIPGSGKSTWAKEDAKSKSNVLWLNADSIRKELYGDESIQGNGQIVFEVLYDKLRRGLLNNKIETIYVDNTSTTLKARKAIYDIVEKTNPDTLIKIKEFNNFELAKERNKNRERVVPDEVMDRMIKQFTPFDSNETTLKTNKI